MDETPEAIRDGRYSVEKMNGGLGLSHNVPSSLGGFRGSGTTTGADVTRAIESLKSEIAGALGRYDERLRKVIAADLRNLDTRIEQSRGSAASVTLNLHVVPNASIRSNAIALAESVRSAAHVIQELSDDPTQKRIIEDVLLTKTNDLIEVLQSQGSDVADLRNKRNHALSLIDLIKGFARTIGITWGAIKAVEEASETAIRLAKAADDLVDFSVQMQNLWELFLDLIQQLPPN